MREHSILRRAHNPLLNRQTLQLLTPAARSAGHGFVEDLLQAGRAECAGLVGATGDDGAVRHRRLGLTAGEVCIQRRPVLLVEAIAQ